jgi:hypothetical protein
MNPHMTWHLFFLILALVLGVLAIPPIASRYNLFAASWTAFLIAQFFT